MKKLFLVGTISLVVLLMFNLTIITGTSVNEKVINDFKKTIKPQEPLLPPGTKIEEVFQPGPGTQIGLIELVQSEGFVQHRGEKIAFKAKRGQSLFIGDNLITGENSRIQARLDDKSVFTLAEYSRLTLNRVVYDAVKNYRDSEVDLSYGKARFKMTKQSEGSSFKIKTPTSVAGVRGSDFALMVYPLDTASSRISEKVFTLLKLREAYAVLPGGMSTTLVTGETTNLSFAGSTGETQLIGPYSLSMADSNSASTPGVLLGADVANGILATVGPVLAFMKMPEYMDK